MYNSRERIVYAPTVIFETKLQFGETYLKNIAKTLQEIPDKQNRTTRVKAQMSDWHLWDEPSAIGCQNILIRIHNHAEAFYTKHYGHPVPAPDGTIKVDKIKMYNAWSLVYNKGDYATKHNHGGKSIISFAYYIQTDKDDSAINFTTMPIQSIQPENDLLVMFPSYLEHWVEPQQSENKRIVISGNFQVDENE